MAAAHRRSCVVGLGTRLAGGVYVVIGSFAAIIKGNSVAAGSSFAFFPEHVDSWIWCGDICIGFTSSLAFDVLRCWAARIKVAIKKPRGGDDNPEDGAGGTRTSASDGVETIAIGVLSLVAKPQQIGIIQLSKAAPTARRLWESQIMELIFEMRLLKASQYVRVCI